MALAVPVSIETERLLLRRHTRADLPAFASFLMDETATRYLALPEEKRTAQAAKERLEVVISSYGSDAATFFLAVVDKMTDEYVGSCGLHALGGSNSAAVYYNVIRSAQRRGIATEATRALVEYAFCVLQVEAVEAFVIPENTPSIRVLEKLGFEEAGSHEQHGQHGLRYRLCHSASPD